MYRTVWSPGTRNLPLCHPFGWYESTEASAPRRNRVAHQIPRFASIWICLAIAYEFGLVAERRGCTRGTDDDLAYGRSGTHDGPNGGSERAFSRSGTIALIGCREAVSHAER